jgi:DNA transposition AAA+ family ATPase
MLKDYLKRVRLNYASFGRRIGYSESAIHKFICNFYGDRNDSALRYRIWKYLEANPPGQKDVCPIERLYDTDDAQLIRDKFYECLEKRRAGIIEGDPGTGKSDIARYHIWELNRQKTNRRAYYIYCPHGISPNGLMQLIAEAVGSICAGSIRNVIANLKYELQDKQCVIVLDEAQHLSLACMETVRELLDLDPRCGLLFMGSHKFGLMLDMKSIEMDLEQWTRRFYFREHLRGISEQQAVEIIRGELGAIPEAAVKQLIKGSRAKAGYISGGRLFPILREMKSSVAPKKKAATA